MNDPTRDARTVIADQLGGSFESNGTDNDWTDQADAVLAALDDAGFVVALVAALGTTHPARCQSCGWAWQHDNPPPATCPHCRAPFAADQEDTDDN